MIPFLVRRWFLLALFTAILLGVGLHAWRPAQQFADWSLFRNLLVAAVLFTMALPLEASAMWRAMRRPLPPGLAIAVNLGLIPLGAWCLANLLPTDLAVGLIVAGATPCTLASAAVWTRKAGGNDAVAILVTILTNGGCFLVTPLWVAWLAGATAESSALELGPMVRKLGTIVVAPMALAQLVRLRTSIGRWATEHKKQVGVFAQVGILTMVGIGSIRTGQRLFGADAGEFAVVELLLMVGLVLSLHSGAFGVGWLAAAACRVDREDQIAIGFAGSQKTLMVGLQVSLDLGVSILPMITYHVGQLIIDTLLADRIAAGNLSNESQSRMSRSDESRSTDSAEQAR